MNEQAFQIVMVSVNVVGSLFFWAMRQEVKHVRELLEERIDEQERRIANVEAKCVNCPIP